MIKKKLSEQYGPPLPSDSSGQRSTAGSSSAQSKGQSSERSVFGLAAELKNLIQKDQSRRSKGDGKNS